MNKANSYVSSFLQWLSWLTESAIAEGHGDAAIELLKAGAEADKRDKYDQLAIDTTADQKVPSQSKTARASSLANSLQVRAYVISTAEREGINIGQMSSSGG